MKSTPWIPHKYQVLTISKMLVEKYLALFIDPGLGKTTISLCAFDVLKHNGMVKGMLVIAPLRPCYLVWPEEIKKWANFRHLKCTVLHNAWPGDRSKELWNPKNEIFIINPEGLPWLREQLKGKRREKWPFDMLVVDESTKFKNMNTKKYKLLRPMLPVFKRRYILTGTPVPNGIINIQGQMALVDMGEAFGIRVGYFREKYFTRIGKPEFNIWVPRSGKVEAIYKKVAKRTIRLKGSDYLDLPKRVNNIIWVDLPNKARKHYDELEKELFTIIEGEQVDTPTAASVKGKCHQIANGCIYKDEDPLMPKKGKREYHKLHEVKLDALQDLIEELGNKPILIGYRFKHDLEQLKKRFGDKLKSLDGVSMKECQRLEKQWNTGKIELLAAYPGSNALGLNLQQQGQDVCWYSQIDDLEAYDQFIKRVERQGSKHAFIRVHLILARHTVDEMKKLQLEGKYRVQDTFLERIRYYAKLKKNT